jgi:hypothetical protein
VVAVSAVVDQPDLRVEFLELAVGQHEIDCGEDVFAVLSDGAGQINDGWDAGSACADEPAIEMGVRASARG